MKRLILQGFITVVLFFSIWYLLRQIDWMTFFKVEKRTNDIEQKLGDLFWDSFTATGKENNDVFLLKSMDSILTRLCTSNNIDKEHIKLHVLNEDAINAFALPDGHLVVYSGLILDNDSPEELSGVIAHELAHVELDHVMKKLVKEVGLSILISMTTGGGGSETIKGTAKMLSSTAFDRGMEKEADLTAVDYLNNANISAEPLANFFYKISDDENEIFTYLSWLSTHPDTKERAEYIIEQNNDSLETKPIISENTWTKLKAILEE